MKKIFLAFAVVSALSVCNLSYAQSSVNSSQSSDSEKSISKRTSRFNAAVVNDIATAADNNAADVNSISKKAVKSFKADYSNASTVKWYTLSNGLAAYCTINGIRNRVFYSKNGAWLHTILDYDEKNLPKDVRATVKRTYYDYTINGVNEVHVENKVIYLVYIKDETSFKTLRIVDGEMDTIGDYSN